jgi:hypothetical protein
LLLGGYRLRWFVRNSRLAFARQAAPKYPLFRPAAKAPRVLSGESDNLGQKLKEKQKVKQLQRRLRES